jgi:hypothetical protein
MPKKQDNPIDMSPVVKRRHGVALLFPKLAIVSHFLALFKLSGAKKQGYRK